jgi:hypothetical protein
MRPSRVVDVVPAGPRSRASIVAIMAKENRRAKVPAQCASRHPWSRTKDRSVVDAPGRWAGFVLLFVRAARTCRGQDEALDSRSRDPVRGFAALSLAGVRAATSRNARRLGGCGSLEQPRNSGVRAFFFSKRRKNKSHRDSRGSGDAGIGHRMHPSRAEHCRGHHRPDEPLRPIGPTQVGGDRSCRAAMLPPSCSPRGIAHPIGRRNCAPPPGKA